MKLKKFAALALAGVMAVSMLAGCAGKGTTDEDKTEVPATGYTAELVKTVNDKVADYTAEITAKEGTSLQTALDAAVKVPGVTTGNIADYMMAADSTLSEDQLPTVSWTSVKDDKVAASTFGVAYVTATKGTYTAAKAAEDLYKQINNKVYFNTLEEQSWQADPEYAPDGTKTEYVYDLSYDVEVAVSTMVNPVDGSTTYVAAYKVTRTPAKVEKDA